MKQKGFTLIELLVVIAIVGILASIIVSSLSTARKKVRMARYVSDMKTIERAFQMAILDEDRDTWWNENEFQDPYTINHIRETNPTIAQYLPDKDWRNPFNGSPYYYDSDWDNNNSCNLWHAGVNIWFNIGEDRSLRHEIDKYVDGEINSNCGKIKYPYSVILYELSPDPKKL